MFGLRRRKADAGDTQIPYQVYETVNEPNSRRRRLLIRLGVALLAATLLFVLLMAWRGSRNEEGGTLPSGASQQLQQPPQANQQLPQPAGEPATTPLSGSNNDRTVDQPQ